jgi:hypothetical protein
MWFFSAWKNTPVPTAAARRMATRKPPEENPVTRGTVTRPIIRVVSDPSFDAFRKPPAGQSAETRSADDPVSWLQIEPGWNVLTAEGDAFGAVAQVAGSKEDDIFDGIAVKALGSTQLVYAPGEQVSAIYPGRVSLKITAVQAAELGPYTEAPPQQALQLPRESLTARVKRWFGR